MKKIVYQVALSLCLLAAANACKVEKDYELIEPATDDYVAEEGGDYYEGEGIDVSMYSRARIFPGLVDTTTEKRLDEVVLKLDLTRRQITARVNMANLPAPVYSTGLYAGAGEKITVELDEDVKGLSIQIGIHTRDLSDQAVSLRDPRIVASMPLFQGINEIRNPYGGPIWILRSGSDGADKTAFPLKIRGAYAAPDYILGETQADEWVQRVKETTVPWMELRGKDYVFSVPTKYIKRKVNATGTEFASRLEESLRLWDERVRYIYQFYGLNGDEMYHLPDFPTRAIMDTYLRNERYSDFNGNMVELLETEELIDLIANPEAIKMSDENTAHILGWLQSDIYKPVSNLPVSSGSSNLNDFSTVFPLLPHFYFLYKNKWWNGQNTTVQAYQVRLTNVMQTGSAYKLSAEKFDKLTEYCAADSLKLYSVNIRDIKINDQSMPYVDAAFAFFGDLIGYRQANTGKDGWSFLGYYNRYLMTSRRNEDLADGLLNALTIYFERDFSALFDRWGIPVSITARLNAKTNPPVEKSIWLYNPITDNEVTDFDGKSAYTPLGETPFEHNRFAWVAAAYSGSGGNEQVGNYKDDRNPSMLFDGDRNTLWESYYDPYQDYADEDGVNRFAFHTDSLYYKAKTPDYPYSIVIKPGDLGLDKIDGFYMANSNTSESSIYNVDIENYDSWNYHIQHIIIEVTSDPLEYEEDEELFINSGDVRWKRVYDSDDDIKGSPSQQWYPNRHNTFYVEFDTEQTNVKGIRLIFDRDTHIAKDRPLDWDEEEKPRRPEFTNKYLNRIQKMGEFGTFYYLD